MTLVVTANVTGQIRGAPVCLPNRRRRLSTIVARHRPTDGRRFIVSVHRGGADVYQPNDATVRLRKDWRHTLVGADDTVLITIVPLGRDIASIGLAVAAIALIALAPYAAPLAAGSLLGLGGAATGGLATAIQAGMVIGGVALSIAAQASMAAKTRKEREVYSLTGGGNVPRPGSRKPVLYGKCWSAPPLSQKDYFGYDGDTTVLVKRMTLGLGRYDVHQIKVGDALFWTAEGGVQPPFNSTAAGPAGTAVEILYERPSLLATGDIVSSDAVGGQQLPRPGGNPEWTPWFRAQPQGVVTDQVQVNWTYPRVERQSSQGRQVPGAAGAVFQARQIDPTTGAVIGAPFELVRADEGLVLATTPLRRGALRRWPAPGAYEVRAQNLWPSAVGFGQVNDATWDGLLAFKDDVRIRPQTTEVVIRVRAGPGLTVTAYADISVQATRILPVWTGSSWTEQPTRKAIWAYCDLVRASYGLAQPSGVDAEKARYYANLLPANDTYDGPLEEVSSFWEAASRVLHPLRADPVKVGAVHSFVRDESRAEPRHVLTRRQIVRDSASATYKTKAEGGDVIVEFDRDGDPKRPDEVRYSYGPPSRTPKRYRIAGISDGLHALKHATWLAAVAVFRGAERSITTEWDGRLVYPGDHVLSDLWFLRGKRVYGVASVSGTTLALDVDANEVEVWGYGSIRTRAGREWGILRMRGKGVRGLELHPDDVAALVSQTGLALADVLARDTQDPTTVVLGELVELQETYVARSAIPSDPDHVRIEMVADDPRVWQLLDEDVIAPAPVNADSLAEPLVPQISVLHARCYRIETGIEVAWGVSPTRGARNYEVDLSYDSGATWEVLSPFGPASTGRATMRQSEQPVSVRARAFGRTGLPGEYVTTTFTTVAPVVDGSLVDITTLPPITYENLDTLVQQRIDQGEQALERAEEAIEQAQGAYQAAVDRAAEALDGALARVDALRRGLAVDPAVRQGYIDPIVADVRADLDILMRNATRNMQDIASLRDALTTAGLEVIPAEGRVRFYAIEALQTAVGSTITNMQVTVDALNSKIELYGSVQTGDLSGLVTQITTVQTTLDALQGTIASMASSAHFNAVVARLTTAEQIISAQDAAISARATQATVDAQGIRLTSAEQTISAVQGRIFQQIVASQGANFDAALIPQTISGILDLLQRQQGALSQSLAIANDSIAANFDEQGRATAETRTELLVFQGEASAQFQSVTRAIADTGSALVTVQSVLSARIVSAEASILSEQTVRATADQAMTSRIDGAISRLGAAEANIISEVTTRASADAAQTSRIDAAVSRLGAAEAAIVSEQTTRATADQAQTTRIDGALSRIGTAEANIVTEQTTRASVDQAISSTVTSLTSRVGSTEGRIGTAEANIASEATTRATADSAAATRIDGLTARMGSAEGAIYTEQQTRAWVDGVLTQTTDSLTARLGGAEGYIVEVNQARITGDAILTNQINAAVSRIGGAEAAITTEAQTRAGQDGALSSRIDQVSARAETANAGVANEATARASQDGAFAGQINDLYARSADGTALGRFAMQVQSAPGGVSVRLAAIASTDSYGGRRNAGWFLDLMPDGSSRFVVDANFFALTANGGITYPFTFDGNTLTVPNLRVTDQMFLPGAVSTGRYRYDPNSTQTSIQITTRANSKVLILAKFDGAPNFAKAPGTVGVLTIARNGTPFDQSFIPYYASGNNQNIGHFPLAAVAFWVDEGPGAGVQTYTCYVDNGLTGVRLVALELAA